MSIGTYRSRSTRLGISRCFAVMSQFESLLPTHCFVRIHQTLRTAPAMAAGVTKRLWEMTDVVDMLEAFEAGRDYGNSK